MYLLGGLLKNKIVFKINDFLCIQNERILLENFSKSKIENKNYNFSTYRASLLKDNWQKIFDNYPVAKNRFLKDKEKLTELILSIIKSFYTDKTILKERNIISNTASDIIDIEFGMGDFHNGKSTAIIHLNDGKKIVYKPINGEVTEAYHGLLEWLDFYCSLGNLKYKILNKQDYHWLEFVEFNSCQTKEELREYYIKAGYILCIVYLLNGCDFHYENLISNGFSPIIIDHETIIQPKTSLGLIRFFKQFGEGEKDSVLNSLLLPNTEARGILPKGMCGFGWHKETKNYGLSKDGINRYTDDWKMVTRYVEQSFIKENIPTYKGNYIHLHEYNNEFLYGFESCYKLLIKKRNFLLSINSPLKAFENLKVRYIWRPTNVYMKILNQMKLPENLLNSQVYTQKIKDYLSVAFSKLPRDSDLWLILKFEERQILVGDVPYFEINSSSQNLPTYFGTIEIFFELSCMDNLTRKLNKLGMKDLEFQKKIIIKSSK